MGDIVICRIHIRGGIHVEGTALNDKTIAAVSENAIIILCPVTVSNRHREGAAVDHNLSNFAGVACIPINFQEASALTGIKGAAIDGDYRAAIGTEGFDYENRTTSLTGELTAIDGNGRIIAGIDARAILSVVDNTVLNNNIAAIGHNNKNG